MRAKSLALFLLVLFALPMFATQEQPSSEYATLLAELKSGNTDIDYTRLRLSYPDSPEARQAKDTSEAEKAMASAMSANNYAEALKQANIVLDNSFLDIDAHFVALTASRALGDWQTAAFHRSFIRGMIRSIMDSGDGKTPETAWVVISVREEYVVLRVLGYLMPEQSLVKKDGHSYDAMKVTNPKDGTEVTFYFNVDIPMKHYIPAKQNQ